MKPSFKFLNTITAGGSLVNSLLYLVLPGFSLSLLGQSSNQIGEMNTQVAGACALGMCVINWLSRDMVEKKVQQIIALGNLTMFLALVLVEVQGLVGGAMNWLGWPFVLVDSMLGLGYAFFLFRSYRRSG